MTIQYLQKLFDPDTVAVIGASGAEGSVGATILRNTLRGFQGEVFAVNPNRSEALGEKCYPKVKSIPEPIDVAVIATPASTVPSIVEECGQKGIHALIIVSAGFSEIGKRGEKLQNEIESKRKEYGMRILGPNCLGYIRPPSGINLSFARETPSEGGLAFISQSGAMGSSLLDWSTDAHVGFSAFVSIGNTLDIGFADLIDYFGQEPETKSILLYLETLRNPEEFIRATRPVARRKPIICLKGGKHSRSQTVVPGHVGITPRRDEIYEALFRRVGITRVGNLSDLFACSETLAHETLPEGPNLAVVTNANGPAILALDSILERGGKIASFSDSTVKKLEEILPDQANPVNPLDILGDAGSSRYRECVDLLIEDENVDALLVIYCPQGEASAIEAAEAIVEVAEESSKPLLTAWIGGEEARKGRTKLRDLGIATCSAPERAAKAHMYLHQYSRNLEMLYQTPEELDLKSPDYSIPQNIKEGVGKGSVVLPKTEIRKLFKAYGISTKKPPRADSGKGEIPSTTDSPLTFSTSLGVRRDRLFGSLILLGLPGPGFGFRQSVTVGFPPLNQVLAHRLLEESGIKRSVENLCVDPERVLKNLERTLVSLSQMIVDFPEVKRIEIPRLAAVDKRVEAVDAEITLGPKESPKKEKPRSYLIFSPYPEKYVRETELKDGRPVTIRPIRPEDEPMEADLFETFSERTWRERFLSTKRTINHREMSIYTNVDYRREMAVVGIREEGGREKMLGVARLVVDSSEESGEYAIVVGDPWQGLGLGKELTRSIIEWARDRNLYSIHAYVQSDNHRMIGFCKHLGFQTVGKSEDMIKMNFLL